MSIRFKYNICPLPEFQHVQSYGMPKTIAFLSLVVMRFLSMEKCAFTVNFLCTDHLVISPWSNMCGEGGGMKRVCDS